MLLKVNRYGTCPQLWTCGELEGSEAWRSSDRWHRIWRHSVADVGHPLHSCARFPPDDFSVLGKEANSSGCNTSICVSTTSLLAEKTFWAFGMDNLEVSFQPRSKPIVLLRIFVWFLRDFRLGMTCWGWTMTKRTKNQATLNVWKKNWF